MREPIHAGLTADVFVLRGERFLVLEHGPGLGEGIWYLPGGGVDRGEDPVAATIRETREETGLDVEDLQLLRVWTYATPEGHDTVHATYVAAAPSGDIVLSAEHTAFDWITPRDYIDRWCHERLEAAVPDYAGWIREVRRNCGLIADRMREVG